MERMVGDTEDALASAWPVAGENHRAWNEAAAAAGSDMMQEPGNSQWAVACLTKVGGSGNFQKNFGSSFLT